MAGLLGYRVTGSQSYRVTELQCYRVKALGQLVHGRTCFSYHQHMIATTRGAVIVNVSVLQSLINQAQPASSMLPPTHDMPPMATTRDLLAESTHSRTDRKTRGRGRLHKSFFCCCKFSLSIGGSGKDGHLKAQLVPGRG